MAASVRLFFLYFSSPAANTSPPCTVFSASVWINDQFIQSVTGGFDSLQTLLTSPDGTDHVNALFTFPTGSVAAGADNVITVLYDNMGNEIYPLQKSARGISGFELVGGTMGTWKVQGKLGGYTGCVARPPSSLLAPVWSVLTRARADTRTRCAGC